MQIHWSFEKSSGQARLTGYSPENGSGDSLSNDWTTPRDCVNQALTDELTGNYSETDATRLYSLVESAPDGPGEFWTPAAEITAQQLRALQVWSL